MRLMMMRMMILSSHNPCGPVSITSLAYDFKQNFDFVKFVLVRLTRVLYSFDMRHHNASHTFNFVITISLSAL